MSEVEKSDVAVPAPLDPVAGALIGVTTTVGTTPAEVLEELAGAAVRLTAGAACASVVSRRGKDVRVLFATHDVVADMSALGEEERCEPVPDRLVVLGLGDVTCHQLELDDGSSTHLCVYSRSPSAFDDTARATLRLLAVHGSVALRAALAQDEAGNLERALSSNRMIGTAVGILMAEEKLGAEDALELLRAQSRQRNCAIDEVAEALVARQG
ncbi:MAG: ANTAR domain-containing protein [Ornithinibacter sp.]